MKINRRLSGLCVLVTVFCFLAGNAVGADQKTGKSSVRQFLEQDYLFGTWGGVRTNLSQHGVDFEFLYAGSVPLNLDGGIKHGGVYQGALLSMMDLDGEKLIGLPGGRLHASSIWLHGKKPFSDHYVGDLNKVNLLDFANGFRLWELYYQQKLLDGKITLKAGQLDIASDFIVPEYYNSMAGLSLLNQTFFYPTMAFNVWDQPGFPVGHHALASTPYGAPGVQARVQLSPRSYVQAGVYDGNPDRSRSGTRIHLSSKEGALAYFELGYLHNQNKDDAGLPGNFKLGAWYHTDDFFDMYDATFAAFNDASGGLLGPLPPPRDRGGNYGVYFLTDHYLWLEQGKDDAARQGLIGFFRLATAPDNRNLAQFGADGGLVYKGLIPSRDWDTMSVAFSYLQISDDLRRAQRDINTLVGFPVLPKADYEAVLEMNYKIQLAAWCAVDTSVQRVFHPGGRLSADIPDAWVFSVQTTLRF
jgi:porin